MQNRIRQISGQFLQYITGNLIYPVEDQEHVGSRPDQFWCLDWWTIEVVKCIFEGIDKYNSYDPPRRLKGNNHFLKSRIVEATKVKLNIIEELKQTKLNRVAIVETTRGFDTLFINCVRDWEQIYVYHWSNYPSVCLATESYLNSQYNNSIKFIQTVNSVDGDFVAISPYSAKENPNSFLYTAKGIIANSTFFIKEEW